MARGKRFSRAVKGWWKKNKGGIKNYLKKEKLISRGLDRLSGRAPGTLGQVVNAAATAARQSGYGAYLPTQTGRGRRKRYKHSRKKFHGKRHVLV